jgi:protein-S-isoprenylcysteine O-methyltransferase
VFYNYLIGPDGVFDSLITLVLFVAINAGYFVTESRKQRFAPEGSVRSEKLFPSLGLTLMFGMCVRYASAFSKIGVIRGDIRVPLVVLGVILSALGWGMRIWAQSHTGKWFTGEVAVQSDHQVITSGPYRWMRHPAYTGGMLSSIGFALMLSTWLGAILSVAMLVWAYIKRVPREEALLTAQLGDAYRRYMARTKRFVPFLF